MHHALAGLLAALIPVAAATAAEESLRSGGSTVAAANSTFRAKASAVAAAVKRDRKVCAFALVDGPASSTQTFLGIENLLAPTIAYATVDPFRANNGKALVANLALGFTEADGIGVTADAEVLYPPFPAGGGKGPVVAAFESFDKDDLALMGIAFGTYNNASSGTTVRSLNRTRVEVAYGNGLRCAGELLFDSDFNASVARLIQTSR